MKIVFLLKIVHHNFVHLYKKNDLHIVESITVDNACMLKDQQL